MNKTIVINSSIRIETDGTWAEVFEADNDTSIVLCISDDDGREEIEALCKSLLDLCKEATQ